MIVINEKKLAIIILILIIVVIFLIVRSIFRFIKWFISSIWCLLTGKKRKPKFDPRYSDDWLTRAQARQEIRFENSLPPLKQKAEPLKKTFREKRNETKGKSATGWIFNEETQLWEPPKNMKR